MRKKQDEKPDFLKDLNTGILDDLTKGGKIKNAVGLVGEITELERVSRICGLPFTGYLGKVETPRRNGTVDEVVIAFEEKAVAYGDIGEYTETAKSPAIGDRILLYGKMQTLRDFISRRVLVFVLADYVAVCPDAMIQNDVAVMGELVYTPIHRTTPRGKSITDIFVMVQNVLTNGTCYIPCICWQEQADEAEKWKRGDKVILLARYQSRKYLKHTEEKTAYELSVKEIKRLREAGHES